MGIGYVALGGFGAKCLTGWSGWSGYPLDCYDYKSTCGAKDRSGTQACLHQINQTGPTGPKAPSSLVWQRVAWSILPLSGSSLSGCQTEIALLAALTRCKAPRSLEWEFEKSVEKGLLLECLWKGWRLVMHNACFFSSKCVIAYTKRYNTCSTRFVPLPMGS